MPTRRNVPRPTAARSPKAAPGAKAAPDAAKAARAARGPVPRRRPPARQPAPAPRDAPIDVGRDRRRVTGVALTVVAILVVLAGRVGFVSIVQRAHWQAAAAAQSQSRVVLDAQRGSITDRNGVDLAYDQSQDNVVVNPEQVDNIDYYAHALGPVLGVDETTMRHLLRRERLKKSKQWSQYRVIAYNIDFNQRSALTQMAFPGISIVSAPARQYPAGALAKSLLGITTLDAHSEEAGATGLERQYDSVLHGTSGMSVADKGLPNGVVIPGTQHTRTPRPGSDVELSIDEGIQYQAEQSLLDQVINQKARAGMAVVVDLKTGDVLAMASVRGGAHPHVSGPWEANLPVTYAYSPGSVMKIVPISKAFDSGCITPSSQFTVPDQMPNGTFIVKDDEFHPTEVMHPWDILTQSSNVGTGLIAQHCFTQPGQLDAALRSFGFGRRTGVGFHGEAKGVLLNPDAYGESGIVSNAIGYSLLVTPMQLLDAYSAIARGGVPVQPRLVRAIVAPNGVHRDKPVHYGARVVSSSTADTMRSIFENVVRAGTGYCAAVPGYEVAGKTGTVRKLVNGQYDGGFYATFAGFAPASAPRLASIVMIDDASTQYGNLAAAPVFSEIMSSALLRMHVPAPAPMKDLPLQYAQARAKRSAACSIPHGDALRQLEADRAYAAAHPPTTTTSTTSTTTSTTPGTVAHKKQHKPTARTTTTVDRPRATVTVPAGTH